MCQNQKLSCLEETFTSTSESLDLATILKASQTISEEMEIDRTIVNLLTIVIANAGADKCVLLLQEENELQVIAKVEIGQKPQLVAPIPLSACADLVMSLVNRVKNGLKPLILVNATEEAELSGDLYLQQHQPTKHSLSADFTSKSSGRDLILRKSTDDGCFYTRSH